MVRKTIKSDTKGPDAVTKAFQFSLAYVRNNTRMCIAIGIGVVCAILVVLGYVYYEDKRNERVQYTLGQAIAAFESYTMSGKEDFLRLAEGNFQSVAKERFKRTGSVAQLYLGRIALLKGNKDEAVKLFTEVLKASPGPLLTSLAQQALDSLKDAKGSN
jgi:hypothetical protein